MAQILTLRRYVVSLRSKTDNVKLPGKHIRKAVDIDDVRYERFVLYPRYEQQATEFAKALELVWKQKHWCVYIDELYALTDYGLTRSINRLLTQGRSMGITVVNGLQRPVGVTRFALSQSTHIIAFIQEGRDVKTLVEVTTPNLKDVLPALAQHEFVWYYRPERRFWVGKLQDLQKGLVNGEQNTKEEA